MEGNARERNVVVEFRDRATAFACYQSPEYQAARSIRTNTPTPISLSIRRRLPIEDPKETHHDQAVLCGHTCSLASHIALEMRRGISTVRISFAGEDSATEYLAIQRQRARAALVNRQGYPDRRPAMLAFIAQSFHSKLAPARRSVLFAQVQAFNNYLCATLHWPDSHACAGNRCRGDEPPAIAAMPTLSPESVASCYQLIEEYCWRALGDGEPIRSAIPTCSRWPVAGQDDVDPARFPKVIDHRRRMSERPQVRKAIAEELG